MTNKVNMHIPEYSLQPPAPSPQRKKSNKQKTTYYKLREILV